MATMDIVVPAGARLTVPVGGAVGAAVGAAFGGAVETVDTGAEVTVTPVVAMPPAFNFSVKVAEARLVARVVAKAPPAVVSVLPV